MSYAARLTLPADRFTPFARSFRFVNVDLTGATLHMQVRLYPSAPGAPLIDLPMASPYTIAGLWLASVNRDSDQPVSWVGAYIPQSVMQALPLPAEPGDDLTLAFDFQWTPPGGVKQRRLFGDFIVQGGVSQ